MKEFLDIVLIGEEGEMSPVSITLKERLERKSLLSSSSKLCLVGVKGVFSVSLIWINSESKREKNHGGFFLN